jgi:gluconate 5-dehydrogenase
MSEKLFDISGRVALVTGSSRGIGRALAKGLLQSGCTVVLNGRDARTLAATRDELEADTGGKVLAEQFDVTDGAAVGRGVEHAEEMAGPLDIVVNNAGMQYRGPLTEFPEEMWHKMLGANLTSAFLVGREVARRMATRRRGKIVNVCSLQSERVRPGIAAYSATKGGMKLLTQGMCADLGPYGVQVNGIGPGYFETDLTAPLVADADFNAWIRSKTPLGRWGKMEDLVGALVFFCSPASDFVSGQVLYVDGGMLAVL